VQYLMQTLTARTLGRIPLKRDDFSSNRHPALAYWWSMRGYITLTASVVSDPNRTPRRFWVWGKNQDI
jgi:hypothetical protein